MEDKLRIRSRFVKAGLYEVEGVMVYCHSMSEAIDIWRRSNTAKNIGTCGKCTFCKFEFDRYYCKHLGRSVFKDWFCADYDKKKA